MADMDETKAAHLISEIEDLEVDAITELPFDFFDKQSSRTTRLIATSGENRSIEGRHRWFDFKLSEPAFITTVSVSITGYSDFHEFEFIRTDANGREKSTIGKQKSDIVEVEVNDLCRRVSFRPPSVFFTSPSILSVRVLGIEGKNIPSALDSLSSIESYKDQVIEVAEAAIERAKLKMNAAEKADNERAAVQREITQHKSSLSRLKKTLDDLSSQRSDFIAQNTAADEALRSTQSRLDSMDSEHKSIQKKYSDVRAQVVESEKRLKSLQENINLFPPRLSDLLTKEVKILLSTFLFH
jgi:hypothetical protein